MYSRLPNITSTLCRVVKPRLFQVSRNMSSESDVIFKEIGTSGLIILNRPKALNALNLSMIKKIHPKLIEWESKKNLVVIKGAGEKAFCSGGDVRAVAQAGLQGNTQVGLDFFKNEYAMNGHIGRYKIPYIALVDGILMGGGNGLSLHGKYRVATERTLFAMPETQIGLFTDVGISYILSRLGNLGMFLALSGHRLKGFDVYKTGLATHYCNSQQMNDLEKDILACQSDSDIQTVLKKYHQETSSDLSLAPHMKIIDECFSANTIEEILNRLEKNGSEWAADQIQVMKNMSPTSLKVVLKELNTAKNLNLDQCLQMEFTLAQSCLRATDFFEGVRALLIDKDKKPKWKPASLELVTDEMVDNFFQPSVPIEALELKHKM